MTERRNESRYLCADLVRVDWLAGEGNSSEDFQSEQALLEDISELGGCVQLDHPIPLGATMMISIGEAFFAGKVCYCVYRDYGYFVGMRFEDDSAWSEDTVVPQHLTSLQKLAIQAAGI
jgi:hypothetical protein